jgi:hypothetical protein
VEGIFEIRCKDGDAIILLNLTDELDLFGNPALAADKRYADRLRGYLWSETIAPLPLPLQRLAAAHPDTVDAVFRKILRRRDFTWAEHGEALMRRRKAWSGVCS